MELCAVAKADDQCPAALSTARENLQVQAANGGVSERKMRYPGGSRFSDMYPLLLFHKLHSNCGDYCLCAVLRPKFLHDMVDVRFCRAFRYA